MPFRILHVCGTAEGGTWLFEQVRELRRRGHDTEVVVPGEGSLTAKLRDLGVVVHVIPFRGYQPRDVRRLSRATLDLRALVTNERFDIVHAHLFKSFIMCRLLMRGRRRPALATQIAGVVHLQSPLLRTLDRVTLRWDDILIASCNDFADVYRALGSRTVQISHYGCTTGALDPGVPGAGFRHEQRLREGDIAVGMVAHMYPTKLRAFRDIGVKGHETFIAAATLLAQEDPSLQFFVIGDDFAGDGSYRRALEEQAAHLISSDRMRFLGHRDDIQRVLAGLDILTNPSLTESASYTMIEASLMQKPVVASSVGGLKDTVVDGVTGLLVPPACPAELSRSLARLAADSDLRTRLGIAGREHVQRVFDIESTVATLLAAYETVAEPPHD